MSVKIKIDKLETILSKRKLQKNGDAQRFFTKKCAEYMNTYAPYKTGNMKDVEVVVNYDYIVYYADYAKEQYYNNQGKGYQGAYFGGKRGNRWDNRMKAYDMDQLTKDFAEYVGGRVK